MCLAPTLLEDRLRRARRHHHLPSFRALFEEQVGYVWRVLQRDGVSERELEDACEQVFLTAHRERIESAAHPSVRAWMGVIASRVAESVRSQVGRGRVLLRPLSSEKYEAEGREGRARARARMFASGPSVEARARMLAQLEGELGSEQASTFAGPAAQQGAMRLWMLRVALGVSVLFGGALLQVQDGCAGRSHEPTRAPTRASAQAVDAPESAAEGPAAR